MDELSKRASDQGQEIERIVANYKKDGSARKTNKKYFERILQNLDEAWTTFEAIDNEIRLLENPPLNHPYFINEYYNAVLKVYNELRAQLIQKRDSVEVTDGGSKVLQNPGGTTSQGENLALGANARDTAQTEPTPKSRSQPKDSKLPESKNTESSDIIKTMRRQRGIAQSLCRILENMQLTQDHPRQYYELKSTLVSQHWSQIENQHYTIWELTDDPIDMGYDIDEYIQLEEKVQQTLLQLSLKINDLTTSTTSNPAQQGTNPMLRLPKLTLPKFDGNYLKWRQFYDLYTQMVHNQPLSTCQKMWYLKTNLTGEAEKLIRHLSLTDENYTTAWKMLQDRYNNKRVLVTALVNKILGQPSHAADNSSAVAIKTLHDTTQECLLALENMDVPTTNWDPLLLHILVRKLDKATHTLYEQSLSSPKDLQTIKGFLAFLENRFQSLETLGTKGKTVDNYQRRPGEFTSKPITSLATTAPSCVSCKGNHHLFQCKVFLKMTPSNRLHLVKQQGLCINCLRAGHNVEKCNLRGCKQCNKRHNTLVHLKTTEEVRSSNSALTIKGEPAASIQPAHAIPSSNLHNESATAVTALSNTSKRSYILLSTARVKVTSHTGKSLECRAILDSGSQINIISQRMVKKLGIAPKTDLLFIEGIGQGRQRAQQRVNVLLQSRLNGYAARVEAFVLQNIISPQPTQPIDFSTWAIPQNIPLADPKFNQPDHIDLLLGAEFYHQLLAIGQIKLADGLPTLQNTVFGWVFSGKLEKMLTTTTTCGICTQEEALDNAIERFWRLEEVEDAKPTLTSGENRCEIYFNQTVSRNDTGRFIVNLPFADDAARLGESKNIALRRFFSLERKLATHSELREQYTAFMEEYLRLGHMEEINLDEIISPYYFLPHHGVHKPDSTTTKLRVVFDASAKTSSNVSLNDILHTGPTIQDDLLSILLRFRMYRFVFTADIEKMYRQVLVQQNDRKYQLIFWRSSPNQRLRCYQLRTITYGTSPAPYLAIKCLQRLAEEEAQRYPLGATSILQNTYVDDIITGSNSLTEAMQTQVQLNSLLKGGGFKLRKWCANHPRLLRDILPEDQAIQLNFAGEEEEATKTLGLTWLPKTDQFCIKRNWEISHKITKRVVASQIARLFDPLGIISPVIVTAKIFLQQLWQLKLDWDAALPMDLHSKWIQFEEGLKQVDAIHFPRHVFADEVPRSTQFHAFADASEKAYGAAIYTRSVNTDGRIIVRLLCAKSRVAPVKKVTLPRLELCAAKLAAELVQRVKADLRREDTITHYWTDSEIVLAWINASSSSLPVFVANRIGTIQRLTIAQQWRHVSSKDNPADVLSRGTTPEKLKIHNLWFYGPPFLHGTESLWPPIFRREQQISHEDGEDPSILPVAATCSEHIVSSNPLDRIQHGNSFRRMQRITAYIIRFINRLKNPHTLTTKSPALKTAELDAALVIIIRAMQQSEFTEELQQLKRNKEVNKTSSLSTLAPFLDENRIIRVGGRLKASTLPYDAKHQMVIPYSHPWTKLLMTDIHKENLHCGAQTLLATTRQRFWPIKGKNAARSIIQHCVRCSKAKPKLLSQIMGDLPSTRVQPARPFINSGVDFCGPVYVHYRTRGKRPQKAYIAVFCCFATKAVHLELVGDLTTDAFIGALKRFIGRRGHCRRLYCDNATNFVGARNQLNELSVTIHAHDAQERIASACSSRGIDFQFIPPRAPHFGGLWEAAVKSAKHLLQRSMMCETLTYEELETVIVEIEAILNSRPLTPMSSDPNDLAVLTPGHFLIGEPLTAPVDPCSQPCRKSLLKRWRLVSHIKHEFWQRWSGEYLTQLQHRYKWRQRCQNIDPGTIVVLKEDNVPVMKWPLGRIEQVYKGNDQCVRVADVRTATGILRRPIHKLAPLPTEAEIIPDATNVPTDDYNHEPAPNQQDPITNLEDDLSNCDRSPSTRRLCEGHSPRKRVRTSLSSLIVSAWIVCLCLPTIRGTPIEVTNFNTRPGIHFEHLGTTSLVSTEWNMVAYYDLQPYWTEFDALKNGTRTLGHLCDQIKQKSFCNPVVTQFEHVQNELSNDNELLTMQDEGHRRKRGAFNIVGNIANSLFGVLDSQYAEEMAKNIDAVRGNENHLLLLLKNQTSIIDSTINIIKRDQVTTNKKFHELEVQMNQLINRINDNGEGAYQLKILQLFSSLSIQLTLIASNIQRIHTSILDALTDSHHGRISPELLSPPQLRQEIQLIQNHLPLSLRLPVNHENILQLYKLISVEGRAVNNYVIFNMKMPLVNLDQFDLFRIWPIPVNVNNIFLAVRPCSSYLAVTSHRDQYYPLTEAELASCEKMNESIYLCKQRHPIYQRRARVCACELNFLNEVFNPTICQLTKIEDDPIWIQLSHDNQWIYALREKTQINVVCSNETATMSLNGSGLLKIKPDCIIKHELVTLQGHYLYPSLIRTSYTRSGDLVNITTPERLNPILQGQVHYQTQLRKLEELQEEIKGQKLHLPNQVHTPDLHNLIVSYTGLFLAIIIILWLLYKFRENVSIFHRTKPKPLPRRQGPSQEFVINVECDEG